MWHTYHNTAAWRPDVSIIHHASGQSNHTAAGSAESGSFARSITEYQFLRALVSSSNGTSSGSFTDFDETGSYGGSTTENQSSSQHADTSSGNYSTTGSGIVVDSTYDTVTGSWSYGTTLDSWIDTDGFVVARTSISDVSAWGTTGSTDSGGGNTTSSTSTDSGEYTTVEQSTLGAFGSVLGYDTTAEPVDWTPWAPAVTWTDSTSATSTFSSVDTVTRTMTGIFTTVSNTFGIGTQHTDRTYTDLGQTGTGTATFETTTSASTSAGVKTVGIKWLWCPRGQFSLPAAINSDIYDPLPVATTKAFDGQSKSNRVQNYTDVTTASQVVFTRTIWQDDFVAASSPTAVTKFWDGANDSNTRNTLQTRLTLDETGIALYLATDSTTDTYEGPYCVPLSSSTNTVTDWDGRLQTCTTTLTFGTSQQTTVAGPDGTYTIPIESVGTSTVASQSSNSRQLFHVPSANSTYDASWTYNESVEILTAARTLQNHDRKAWATQDMLDQGSYLNGIRTATDGPNRTVDGEDDYPLERLWRMGVNKFAWLQLDTVHTWSGTYSDGRAMVFGWTTGSQVTYTVAPQGTSVSGFTGQFPVAFEGGAGAIRTEGVELSSDAFQAHWAAIPTGPMSVQKCQDTVVLAGPGHYTLRDNTSSTTGAMTAGERLICSFNNASTNTAGDGLRWVAFRVRQEASMLPAHEVTNLDPLTPGAIIPVPHDGMQNFDG